MSAAASAAGASTATKTLTTTASSPTRFNIGFLSLQYRGGSPRFLVPYNGYRASLVQLMLSIAGLGQPVAPSYNTDTVAASPFCFQIHFGLIHTACQRHIPHTTTRIQECCHNWRTPDNSAPQEAEVVWSARQGLDARTPRRHTEGVRLENSDLRHARSCDSIAGRDALQRQSPGRAVPRLRNQQDAGIGRTRLGYHFGLRSRTFLPMCPQIPNICRRSNLKIRASGRVGPFTAGHCHLVEHRGSVGFSPWAC